MVSCASRTDEDFMRRCLELAQTASDCGNIGVGAILVNTANGTIVAEAAEELPYSSNDVSAHAEILVIRRACEALDSKDLSSCTLFTTAEPCWMCSYAIREVNIHRVVYGTNSGVIGGVTSKHPLLILEGDGRAPSHWGDAPTVVQGVLADECLSVRDLSRARNQETK